MPNLINAKTPSVMQHSFSRVPQAHIPRNSFKSKYRHTTTMDVDYLYPLYLAEVLPGDTAIINSTIVARFPSLLTPFMDNVFIDTFWFFGPNRLLQTNWQKLMGEREDPDDSIDYTTPYVDTTAVTGISNGTLFDYFGVPTQVPDLRVRGHFWRMYNRTWNEWFRDQNLQDRVVVDLDDGPDTLSDYVLLKRGKRHDYFTSCLPWPQKGDVVSIPLGTSAPVKSDTTLTGSNRDVNVKPSDPNDAQVYIYNATGGTFNDAEKIYTDLSSATAATLNQLYEAFAVQDLLMTDARGGTRYVEMLKAHFGVTSPDFRMQRIEYLGGGSYPATINPIAQTSETATTELGTLAATGGIVINGDGIKHSFVEHGYLMCLVCVRADLTYQQGLPRFMSRETRYDYYFPALAHLGEQEVLNKEIYAVGSATPGQDDLVFGYQERWSEYRYGRSMISGKMRSNDAQSLDIWHLAEEFGSLPALDSTFIQQNTPIDRVLAVTGEPDLKVDMFISQNWIRPIPTYSVPGLIQRF